MSTKCPNHIIITDGYFIVGDMIKQIFSLKKQNKKWNCLFLIFGWFHNKSITRYYFRFVFFSTSAFYLIGERINKKKINFSVIILTSISFAIQCHDQGRNPSVPIIQNQSQQNKKILVFLVCFVSNRMFKLNRRLPFLHSYQSNKGGNQSRS
jgi:hypothetical protein